MAVGSALRTEPASAEIWEGQLYVHVAVMSGLESGGVVGWGVWMGGWMRCREWSAGVPGTHAIRKQSSLITHISPPLLSLATAVLRVRQWSLVLEP